MTKCLSDLRDTLALKQDEMLTIEQASIYLNMTRQTINNYVKAGKLHPKKLFWHINGNDGSGDEALKKYKKICRAG